MISCSSEILPFLLGFKPDFTVRFRGLRLPKRRKTGISKTILHHWSVVLAWVGFHWLRLDDVLRARPLEHPRIQVTLHTPPDKLEPHKLAHLRPNLEPFAKRLGNAVRATLERWLGQDFARGTPPHPPNTWTQSIFFSTNRTTSDS